MQNYRSKAYEPGVKKQVLEMAINGSGIRDTARVLTQVSEFKSVKIATNRIPIAG